MIATANVVLGDDEQAEKNKFIERLGRDLVKLNVVIHGDIAALESWLAEPQLSIEQCEQTRAILDEFEVNCDCDTLAKTMDPTEHNAKLLESEAPYTSDNRPS